MECRAGSLLPKDGSPAQYAQSYIYESPERANQLRAEKWRLDKETVEVLQEMFYRCNPFAVSLLNARQIWLEQEPTDLQVRCFD